MWSFARIYVVEAPMGALIICRCRPSSPAPRRLATFPTENMVSPSSTFHVFHRYARTSARIYTCHRVHIRARTHIHTYTRAAPATSSAHRDLRYRKIINLSYGRAYLPSPASIARPAVILSYFVSPYRLFRFIYFARRGVARPRVLFIVISP